MSYDRQRMLDSRNILVPISITGHGQDHDQYVMAIHDPRRDTTSVVSFEVVARHAEFFKQNRIRFIEAIRAEIANEP